MKKICSWLLAISMLLGVSTVAMAEGEESIQTELVEYMIQVNQQLGLVLTESEIEQLEITVEQAAKKYSEAEGITMAEAYDKLLEEAMNGAPLLSASELSAYASRTVVLPTASTGAIFFIDSESAWNHVGLYTSSTYIVESMPEDGVQYWKYNDPEAYQNVVTNPADGVNDSCIMTVDTTTSKRKAAAAWPGENIEAGTPYDYDFLDNKQDYYTSGANTTKSELDALNCSELVWKAYKKAANIDLDGNGGLGVYPNDVLDSDNTTKVQGNWW